MGGSGRDAPLTPPVWTMILGPCIPPKSDPKRVEFFRFFGPCGATSRGGGGAPPTTLILLRNQVNARVAAARPTAGTAATVSGP